MPVLVDGGCGFFLLQLSWRFATTGDEICYYQSFAKMVVEGRHNGAATLTAMWKLRGKTIGGGNALTMAVESWNSGDLLFGIMAAPKRKNGSAASFEAGGELVHGGGGAGRGFLLHLLNDVGWLLPFMQPCAASVDGFEIWSKLTKLKVLDLSGNMLNDSIITSLVALSTIRSLFLNYTALSSAVTIQQLSTMKLETLDLSDNAINGTISTGICNMEILQELHLNDNMLFGELPSCIGNLTSLRVLDLSNNLLRVKFPSPSFAKFTSLVKLSLSNNHLEGVLFLSSLSNNRQLTHLELASSGNDFQLQTENPATDMSAQLQVLVLRNCNLNGNSAVIPRFLLHQHSLDLIDMSNNNLGGYFPSWLIENNVNLSYLILRDQEEFMTKSRKDYYKGNMLNYMSGLDFSSNQLKGSIPESIELAALRSLEVFSVAYNNLSGPTPGIKGQFITFDQSSYEGNPYLCGPPLLSCSEAPSVPELEENKEDDKVDDIILFGCSAMFYMVGFWTSMGVLYFKTSWRWSWFSVVDRFSDCVMAKLAIYTRKIRGAN
ncbi:uncharacterized protein [Aegilops tauschii subsp. strangulata]|uniref:Protein BRASSINOSTEROID INSENSITIVE 1 n=1 Tax=Aegilops tauschii TaxID=37682 RepID=M8C6B4_AEGTA